MKRSVYCQYGWYSLTFQALALRQRETENKQKRHYVNNKIRTKGNVYIVSRLPNCWIGWPPGWLVSCFANTHNYNYEEEKVSWLSNTAANVSRITVDLSGIWTRPTEICRPKNVRPKWRHISRGSRGIPRGKCLKFGSRKWHFLHFEDTFEQNLKVSNHIWQSIF